MEDPGFKDFVEHLRTVHFTLIAACCALLLALSIRQRPGLDVAVDDIRWIRDVAPKVTGDWLQDLADDLVGAHKRDLQETKPFGRIILDDNSSVLPRTIINLHFIGVNPKHTMLVPEDEDRGWWNPGIGVEVPGITTLADWKMFWQGIRDREICVVKNSLIRAQVFDRSTRRSPRTC